MSFFTLTEYEKLCIPPSFPEDHPLYVDRDNVEESQWKAWNTFIHELELRIGLKNRIFDFNGYMYHRINGQGSLYLNHSRFLQSDLDNLYRFVELFQNLGFFVMYAWMRLGLMEENSLWVIIYNEITRIHFLNYIHSFYQTRRIELGLDQTSRQRLETLEKTKDTEIQWFREEYEKWGIPPSTSRKTLSSMTQDADPNDVEYIQRQETREKREKRLKNTRKRIVFKCILDACLLSYRNEYKYNLPWPFPIEIEKEREFQPIPSTPSLSPSPSPSPSFEDDDDLSLPPPLSPGLQSMQTMRLERFEDKYEVKDMDHAVQIPMDPLSLDTSLEYNINNHIQSANPNLSLSQIQSHTPKHDKNQSIEETKTGSGQSQSITKGSSTSSPESFYLFDVTTCYLWGDTIKPVYNEVLAKITDLCDYRFNIQEIEHSIYLHQSFQTQMYFIHWVSLLYSQKRDLHGQNNTILKVRNGITHQIKGYEAYMKGIFM